MTQHDAGSLTPWLERRRALRVALGALGTSNVVVNRVLPDPAYVPWNLALATGLLWLARRTGADADTLGLDPRQLGRGVRTGAVAAGAVAGAYGLGAAVEAGGSAMRDRRVTELSPRQARYQALVRIPLGTVVFEEVAFRGVLPALLRTPTTPAWLPGVASSALFGLWHVLPSQELAAANDGVGWLADRVGRTGTTAMAVVSTAAAGGVLHALRRHGGHLAAPVAAHWAVNALGLVAARWVSRLRPRQV